MRCEPIVLILVYPWCILSEQLLALSLSEAKLACRTVDLAVARQTQALGVAAVQRHVVHDNRQKNNGTENKILLFL